jgi:hypothetical protein
MLVWVEWKPSTSSMMCGSLMGMNFKMVSMIVTLFMVLLLFQNKFICVLIKSLTNFFNKFYQL